MNATTKKLFWKSSNFWHNLLTFVGSIWVTSEAQTVIAAAKNVTDAVFAPEVQLAGIITAAFTLVNMIYQLFIKPKKPGEEVIESKILSVLERKGIDKLLS